MKLKPLLLPLIVVTIITAVVLYWRSWLHELGAAEAAPSGVRRSADIP
jgi:hypothetical protein